MGGGEGEIDLLFPCEEVDDEGGGEPSDHVGGDGVQSMLVGEDVAEEMQGTAQNHEGHGCIFPINS